MKNFQIKIFILALSGLFIWTNILAQQSTISGKVTDASDGTSLIGATIVIKGSTQGTVTNINGEYSINIQTNDQILVFSYVGYVSQEIVPGERTEINVLLQPNLTELEEIVVVGYGVQKKGDLTGAISVVDGKTINRSNPVNVGAALQGRAAGVSVTTSSGQPGANTSIKIRGIGSISNSTTPLFVVDGVLTDNRGIINTLNPEDIESMSILKDASAAAIYGSRGANGVIVITTKRGTSGKTSVNFSAYTGITQIPKLYNIMNADEYSAFSDAAWNAFLEDNTGGKPLVFTDSIRAVNGAEDNNWLDLITQTGKRTNYNLSMSSGNDKMNYMLGLNYYDETGVLINTGYTRFSGRFNSDLQIADWLKIGESLTLSYGDYAYTSHKGENPWRLATISSPLMPVYETDNTGGYAGPFDYITGPNDKSNPYAEQMLNQNEEQINQLIGNIFAEIRLLPGLTYKFDLGLNYRIRHQFQFSPKYDLARAWSNASSQLEEGYGRSANFQINNLLTYKKSVKAFNFTLLAGQSAEMSNYRDISAVGKELSFEKQVMSLAQTISQAQGIETDDRFSSLFGRLNFDFKRKYLFTATIRRDGSSRFGPGNRYGYFPSFSAGWKINEDFFENVEPINMLKLRMGWGQTGNAAIPNYLYIDRIANPLETRYPFGPDEIVNYGGTIIRSFANPDIKWEASAITNIGIDANLFRNRLQFTAEYYYKKQDGMLLQLTPFHFSGRSQYSARQPVNLGAITNKGIEFSITFQKMEGDLNYSINGNITTIKNRIESLPNDDPLVHGNSISKIGHTIGSFYGWVAERIIQESDFDEEGNYLFAEQNAATAPGDIKFKDINRDGLINTLDQVIIGKPVPDFIYGFNFDVYYKNFDLNAFIEGIYGNEIYNQRRAEIGIGTEPSTKNWNRLKEVGNFWSPENPSTIMTRASVVDVNDNDRTSTWFVEDGSYLRLKNVQLGYTLPEFNNSPFSNLRVYINSTNLLTITNYSGLDPEINSDSPTSSGFDGGRYPIPKSHTVGIQLTF
jgi:TonB-linked SusC/RagA family outer membrane protein